MARRPTPPVRSSQDLSERTEARHRLRRYAWFLDNSIPLPLVGRRVGVDAVIGLVPGIGDALGALLSGYVLVEAVRIGVSKAVFFRMALNVLIELTVGAVPFLGDVFDAFYKANQRNVTLLEDYLDAPRETARTSRAIALAIAAALLVLVAGVIALGVFVVRWLWIALDG